MWVYKVVRTGIGLFLSITNRQQYVLEYRVNEWTYPKIGKLFAFRTFTEAERFVVPGERIFLAWATDVEDCEYLTETRYWEDYWEGLEAGYCPAPKGTVTCSAIKLIKGLDYISKYD